ncbi:hypothetical protein BDV95DRAFT_508975 [Massariosphaeria phaeospora]|uniref:Zn(2)-C6 fungal-type domain-containing protein n=1 Tax=Massariosphaeria phaeospora TaxID=100035 RepID=A0A7C8HY98_9PLEO|nr:hypothetical protein BDV95DRAFT_508975 [Massariosphaeria phaeospora]
MLRRSHKKSRGGCAQCKQRHVKCDEGRPVCMLCTMSGRDCSFASQALPQHSAAAQSTLSQDQDCLMTEGLVQLPTSIPTPASSEHQSINLDQDADPDEPINLNHMELIIHLTEDQGMFNLSDEVDDLHAYALPFALKTGLKSPYLLHQMLAFSARHLAFLHPGSSATYIHQAISLQTRAVSLFNSTHAAVDQSNCVAILLFSTILGQHLLADTLAKRDPGGLEPFLAHYLQCAGMHRGIHSIAESAWPQLMVSELEPVLSSSHRFTSRQPKGHDCDRIKALVDSAAGLSVDDKTACRVALQYLQVGLDAALNEEEQGNRFKMINAWSMLVPPEFRALLAAKRPEALAVMAHYALLLHYGRAMWQVGDSGVYLLGLIVDYLGPPWSLWLDLPREGVASAL